MFRHSNPYAYHTFYEFRKVRDSLMFQLHALRQTPHLFVRRLDNVRMNLELLTEAENIQNRRRARTICRTSRTRFGKMVKPIYYKGL